MKTTVIKSPLVIVLTVIFIQVTLFSCGNESNSNSNTTDTSSLDTSFNFSTTSPNEFGKSVVSYRMEKEAQTIGHEISYKVGYINSDSSFFIVNFTEFYEQGNFISNYSIAINSSEIIPLDENIGRVEELELQEILKSKSISYAFLKGEISESLDFTLDGSKDFLLTNSTFFKTDINETQQIILYNGEKSLFLTDIKALSSYTTESIEWEGISGEKEKFTFLFNKNKTPTIVLEHYHDDIVEEVGRTHITYSLLWQWNVKNNFWETGVICNDCGNYVFSEFTDKWVRVSEEGEGYVIKESCQNGGVDYFQLVKHKTVLSEIYKNASNSDDNGSYTVVHINPVGSNYYIFYVSFIDNYIEDVNNTGFHSFNKKLEKWEVHKNSIADFPDLIKMGPMNFLYTNKEYMYSKKTCN